MKHLLIYLVSQLAGNELFTRPVTKQGLGHFFILCSLYFIIIINEVGSVRLGESDIHPISPTTPAIQCQPIDRKNR